jgi:ATP/maltotriose-dependent transcriptional regulator MalT
VLGAVLAFQGLCAQTFSKHEGRVLAQESLSILHQLPPGKEMIYALQLLAMLTDDEAEKTQITQDCLAIARVGQFGWWIPLCLIQLSDLAVNRGNYTEAKAILEGVLNFADENNYQASLAQAFSALSQIAMLEGKFAEAKSLAQKALAAAEDMGYTSATWGLHSAIADNALLQADYHTAQIHYQNGLAICQELNERRGALFQLSGLGGAACGLREYSQARRFFCDALYSAKEVNSLTATLDILSGIAGLLANTGEPEQGLRLAVYIANQPSLEKITGIRNKRLLESLETDLAPEVVVSAREQGKQFDVEATISQLLTELSQLVQDAPASSALPPLYDALTEREIEVLRLIAAGLSNYDIAVRLFVGVSTVKKHINHIFDKLDVKSRTQALLRARELRLL